MNARFLAILVLLGAGCGFMDDGLDYYYEGGTAPTISSLSVASELGNLGGVQTTIQGSGFGTDPGRIVVRFGDKNAEILTATDSSLLVVTPAGPATGGPVDLAIGTEGGQALLEDGYVYDNMAPLQVTGDDYYADERGFVELQNFWGTAYGSAGYVGEAGIYGSADFMTFAYPRYHMQDVEFWGAADQPKGSDWYIQRPASLGWTAGIEDFRRPISSVIIENPARTDQTDCIDWEKMELSGDCRDKDVDTAEYGELIYYNLGRMQLCAVQDDPETLAGALRSEYPIGVGSKGSTAADFFVAGEDGSSQIVVQVPDVDITDLTLRLPEQVVFEATEGFGADGADWATGGLNSCFDDEDDDDKDTTLSDTAFQFQWEPDDSFYAANTDERIKSQNSYVRLSLTVLNLSWFGGEGYPIRASVVVPDAFNVGTDGMSHLEVPVSVLYQFPTLKVLSSSTFGSGYDPLDPYFGYLMVAATRVTEFQIGTAEAGDVIVAYSTGDFGIFDGFDHPNDSDGCGNCQDDDGDGWVDNDDPDCYDEDDELGYNAALTCNNGDDDDGDGLVDSDDPDCEEADSYEGDTCLNLIDDDEDGWLDADDPDCTTDGVEAGGYSNAECNDGEDNDGDKLFDAEDPDCTDASLDENNCGNGADDDGDGWIDAADPECPDGEFGVLTGDECNDALDNDGDLLIDASDPDCVDYGSAETDCLNGQDDDADGWIDANDPGCLNGHLNEADTDPAWTCANGLDDDFDGWEDSQDPVCVTGSDLESDGYLLKYACNDGDDNDKDGFTDHDDLECLSATDMNETK